MARPPILALAIPSDTGRVLSIQSHTVQVSLFFSDLVINKGLLDPNFSWSSRLAFAQIL